MNNPFCPNLSNKQVRAEFNELIEAVGSENKAYYYWNANNGYNLDKSPDGDLSESYSQMMFATNGDRKAALKASAETLRIMQDEGATVEDLQASRLFGLKNEDLQFSGDTIDAVISMTYAMGLSIKEADFDREDVLAAANFLHKTIDITYKVEDRAAAWNKVPEEVAHWWYRLLSKNSELKKSLWEAAKNSDKYKELVEQDYGNYSAFENADDAFIEEAIGQLIAEAIYKKQNATKQVKTFFEKFLDIVKKVLSVFIKSKSLPFEEAANRILNSDVSELILATQLPSATINTTENPTVLDAESAAFFRRAINSVLKLGREIKKAENFKREYLINDLKLQFSRLGTTFNIVDIKDGELEELYGDIVRTNIDIAGIDTFVRKYKKSGVPLSQPIKIDGIKKLEEAIYNRALQLVNQYSDEYAGKKTIPVDDFLRILQFVLRDHYNLQFANVDPNGKYSSYMVDLAFENDDARHTNIGMWLNQTRPTTMPKQHFSGNPYAFGAITYFDNNSKGLIHQIQSDYYDIEDPKSLGNRKKLFKKFEYFYKLPTTLSAQIDIDVVNEIQRNIPVSLYHIFSDMYGRSVQDEINKNDIQELRRRVNDWIKILDDDIQKFGGIDRASRVANEVKQIKFYLKHKNYLKLAYDNIDKILEDNLDYALEQDLDGFYISTTLNTGKTDAVIVGMRVNTRDKKSGKLLSKNKMRARAAFAISKKLRSEDEKALGLANKLQIVAQGYGMRSRKQYLENILKLGDEEIFRLLKQIANYTLIDGNQKVEVKGSAEFSDKRSKNAPDYEFLLNYAKPLVHHLIQTIIQEKGKDFPIYIPGYKWTMNLQRNPLTAILYALPQDVGKMYPDLEEPIKMVGYMFKVFNELRGVKLKYVEKVPGLKSYEGQDVDGYLLDLSEYNYTRPMLFGLKSNNSKATNDDEQSALEIDSQNQIDQFQKDTNDLNENMDTYVVNRLKEAKRQNPNVDTTSVIQAAKSEFIDGQHKELINKTAEILIKSFDLIREVDKDGKVTYRRKNQENSEDKADLIIEFLNYLEDDSAGYYDRNSKSTAAHHVISISLSEGDPSTFSHELAHHYIGMFWKSNLIQTALKAIDRPGMTDEEREEELVELITMKTQDEQFLSGLENNSFRQRFYGKLAYLLSRTFNINNKFTRNGLMINAARAFMLNKEQKHIDDQNMLFVLADSRKYQQSTRKERINRARKLAQKERQEIGYEQLTDNYTQKTISNIIRGSVSRNKAFRRDSQNQPKILTNMQLAEDEVRQFVEDIKQIREDFKRSIGKQGKTLNQQERTQASINQKELSKNIKLIRGFIDKARNELLDLAKKIENIESTNFQQYVYRRVPNPTTGEYEIEYLDASHIGEPDVEVAEVTFEELSQILQNTIGFYESVIKDLNLAITSQQFAIDYGIDVRDELISELYGIQNAATLQQEGLNSILKRIEDSYIHTIENRIKQYIRSTVQEQEGLDDLHKERLIYSINTWIQDQNVFGDIGATETWFGLASNSKSPLVRLLQNIIDDMHNKIDINVQQKGDSLAILRKKARKALKRPGWLPINFEKFMMERDSDGFTGNFATRINRGRYESEKDKFINEILFDGKNSYQRQVQDRIGDKWYQLDFDETGEVIFPPGCDDIEKDYLHKVNRWMGKRVVRQFTTEYYDKRIDMLSSLTRRAQRQYDDKINKIVNAASPNGKFQSELLTKAKRDELKRLYERKQQLSNPYDRYGVLKPVGSDEYVIAKELSEWHEFVKDKIKYKLDRQSFDESLKNAIDKDTFIRENTYKMINPEIWEEAKRIYPNNNNIPKLEKLIERRRKLISIIKRRGYNYPNIEEIWDSDNKKIRDEYSEFWENLKKLDEQILSIRATLPKPAKNIKAAAAYRALLSEIDVMSPHIGSAGRRISWLQYIETQITERVNQDYANDPNKNSILKKELEKVHAITRIQGQIAKEQGLSIFSMTGPSGETVNINGKDVQAIIDEPIQAYSIVDIENSDSRYVDVRYDQQSDVKTQLLSDDTIDQTTGKKYDIKSDEANYTNYDFIKNIENGPKEVKDYYDALIQAMKESYERIPFVGKYDFRLPQRGASSQQLLWRNALRGQYFKTSDYQWANKNRITRGISSTIDFLLKPIRDWGIFNPIRAYRYRLARKWGTPNESDEDINFDYETRPDGTRSMNIPIRYIQRIPNPAQINSDVFGGVMSFYQMSLNYKEKTEKLPLFNTVLAKLDSNQSNNTRQRTMIRGMVNRQFYDRLHNFDTDEKNLTVYTSETIKWLLKFLPGLKGLTQTGLLALGWLAGIVAYLDPLIQFTVDATQGKYIDISDYIAGNLTVVANMLNAIRGLGSHKAYGFVPSGMRYFGLSRPGANNFQKMNLTPIGRFFNLNLLMSPFSLGEYTIKAQTFGAVMHSYRYYKKPNESVGKFYDKKEFIEEMTKSGIMSSTEAARYFNIKLQFKTLYKAYHTDFKTGEFSKANNEYGDAITEEFENKLKKRMKNRATNYNYIVPETERTKIQSNVLTSFVTVMRTFMLVGFAERLRSGNDFQIPHELIADEYKQSNLRKQLKNEYYADKGMYNFQTGEIENGTFQGFFNVLFKHTGRYLRYALYNMRHPFLNRNVQHFVDKREELNLSDTDIYGFNRTLTEMLVVAILAGCQVVFYNSMDGDDKDDYWMQAINHILIRISIERMTFMNPNTLMELVNSITPSKSDFDRKFKLFDLIQDVFVGFRDHGTQFDEWEKVKGSSAYKGKPVAFRDLMQTLSSLGAHNLYTSSSVSGIQNKTKWYRNVVPWRGFWEDSDSSNKQSYSTNKQQFENSGGGFEGFK